MSLDHSRAPIRPLRDEKRTIRMGVSVEPVRNDGDVGFGFRFVVGEKRLLNSHQRTGIERAHEQAREPIDDRAPKRVRHGD